MATGSKPDPVMITVVPTRPDTGVKEVIRCADKKSGDVAIRKVNKQVKSLNFVRLMLISCDNSSG